MIIKVRKLYDFPDLNKTGFHEKDLIKHVLFDKSRRRIGLDFLNK